MNAARAPGFAVLRWVLVLALSAAAAAQDPRIEVSRLHEQAGDLLRSGKYLEAVEVFREAVRVRPEDPRSHLLLGTTLLGIWRYAEARTELSVAQALDGNSIPARVWLARCDIQDFEYRSAFRRIQESLAIAPRDPDAMAMLALLLIHLDDLDRADEAIARALEASPGHSFARICLAHLRILRKDPQGAARMFAEAILENRWNATAYAGLGQALSSLDRSPEALTVLDAGIRRNPFLPPLHATRAFVLFKLKRVEDACGAYRDSLALDAEYAGGHGIQAFFQSTEAESRLPEEPAREHLLEAVRAMEAGDPETARERAGEAVREDPECLFAWQVLGSAAFDLEDFEAALDAARKGMAVDPLAPLPRTLFVASLTLKQECRRLELSKIDFLGKFRAAEVPEVPGIERVFPNYASLTADGKKVVRKAVAPFGRYLPDLEKEKVVHFLLPLYRHLTDLPGMTEWKGHPTFDGRTYDAVRGAAGSFAVSGVETLWPATRMGANVIAHEFAHQIHRFGLQDEDRSEINRLFRRAKKEGLCLDYYAAENDQEYFAQGYEAFVSPFKRPTSSETAKNTRSDLEAKDPELFSFLLRVTDRR
jgi:Flp pilus assembly protein TadD